MKADVKKNSVKINKWSIMAYLVYALAGAVGIFFIGLGVLHIDIYTTDSTLMSWIFVGITIQIWLYLIFKNID